MRKKEVKKPWPERVDIWIKEADNREKLEDINKVLNGIPDPNNGTVFTKIYFRLWEFVKEGAVLINEGILRYSNVLKKAKGVNLCSRWKKLYKICLKVKEDYKKVLRKDKSGQAETFVAEITDKQREYKKLMER